MIKILGIILLVLLLLVLIIICVLMINHQRLLKKEAKVSLPLGTVVHIQQRAHHVYVEGDKEHTLVFMAGHGTSCPTIDFKPLWMRMVDEYTIAVVEKSGYGWSEPSNNPRDIDTILEETRTMVTLAGLRPPFVLIPHSMSALEALYWAQKYPDEVQAIIGLDPLIPGAIELLSIPPKVQLQLLYAISRIGVSRLMGETEREKNFPLLRSDDVSEEDKRDYIALFYRSSFTKDMKRELAYLDNNGRIVAEQGIPKNIPMYFFISEEQEATAPGWKDEIESFMNHITTGYSMSLDASHYIHHTAAATIAQEAKAFLNTIWEKNR